MNKPIMFILGSTLLFSVSATASEHLCNAKSLADRSQLILSEDNFTKERANVAYNTLIKLQRNSAQIRDYDAAERDLFILEGYLLKSQAIKNKQMLPEFCSFLTSELFTY